MGKKSRKNKSKSPARQRPPQQAATPSTSASAATAAVPAPIPPPPPPTKAAPPHVTRPNRPDPIVPIKKEIVAVAAEPAPVVAVQEQPVAAPAPAPAPITSTTTSTSNTMSSHRVTLEHLDIIHKYGGNSVDQSTAVVDMHNHLKAADGGLSTLSSSQYAFVFNPLKEAIWFSRKGQFAIGCAQDWTLAKLYMTIKSNISTLTTNLSLLDLEDIPGDDTVTALKTLGNKMSDDMSNAWFHIALEALYDLVEIDSTAAQPSDRRDALVKRVGDFVYKGSRNVYQTATPMSASIKVNPQQAPRFSFAMILTVYLKLKELGPSAVDVNTIDWASLGLPHEDAVGVWMALQQQAQLSLPQTVWWKVLFILVMEFEPHLLRMNLTLLDSANVKTFQDFLDECMEPPDQIKGSFYKKMIQQVFSLQNLCLLTSPPRPASSASVLDELERIFASGEGHIYSPAIVQQAKASKLPPAPAPAPTPPPAPAPSSGVVDVDDQAELSAAKRAEEEAVKKAVEEAQAAAKLAAEEAEAAKAAEEQAKKAAEEEAAAAAARKAAEEEEAAKLAAEEEAAKIAAEEEAAKIAAEEEAAKIAAEEEAARIAAEEEKKKKEEEEEAALAAEKAAQEEQERLAAEEAAAAEKAEAEKKAAEKPPLATIHTISTQPRTATSGRPPRSPPVVKDAGIPDNISLAGSLAELNKEEALLDLMRQAAAMCENITQEKQLLVTKERRMGRNLRSAEDNLKALQTINAQLMAENNAQKQEIYQREDDINQLHRDATHAARELSNLDNLNSQLHEQIDELKKNIEELTKDKMGLVEELEASHEETTSLKEALELSRKEKEALKAEIAAEKAAKEAVEKNLAKMQEDKDAIELKLKGTQEMLAAANEEIDRLEELQAEQQHSEAEARREAMEARRREYEAAEKAAEESLRKAEELRKLKAAARKARMFG